MVRSRTAKWFASRPRSRLMTKASQKLKPGIARRDLLAAAGTLATAVAVSPALAQAPAGRGTVLLDRLPAGVLLIGIDRAEAQNRIGLPTFNELGQAHFEIQHDHQLRGSLIFGKGPEF